jgi:hypothetical protein
MRTDGRCGASFPTKRHHRLTRLEKDKRILLAQAGPRNNSNEYWLTDFVTVAASYAKEEIATRAEGRSYRKAPENKKGLGFSPAAKP